MQNSVNDFRFINPGMQALFKLLSDAERSRVKDYATFKDFYDGNHWDLLSDGDEGGPRVTFNYCASFSNVLSSLEMRGGVNFKFKKDVEAKVLPFLNNVYEDNSMASQFDDFSVAKSIAGDSFFHVYFSSPTTLDDTGNIVANPDYYDPYGENPNGKIVIKRIPSAIVFPEYEEGYEHTMKSCRIIYPYKGSDGKYHVVIYLYTKAFSALYVDDMNKPPVWRRANTLPVIPIFHFRNLSVDGSNFGCSDLVNVIPLNMEYNVKASNSSVILDYHSSPITCVFGANINQLEKGPGKLWGGLPKDGDVKHLEMKSDLAAASAYMQSVKAAMHEVAGVAKLATGSVDIPANISSVALNLLFGPMLDIAKKKRNKTAEVLVEMNKYIIALAKAKLLLKDVDDIPMGELLRHEVVWGPMLPKDSKSFLEEIQQMLKMSLTTRREAMKSLSVDNIEELLPEIDKEAKEHPFIHGVAGVILNPGQKLINPDTGEVIAEVEGEPTGESSSQQPKGVKPVGTNKDGQDLKINSGMSNSNPGSEN